MKYLVLILCICCLISCRPFNQINNLKPGKSVQLEDIRHEDYVISCEVARDSNRPIQVNGYSSHQLFRDAYNNIEKARTKYTMERVRLVGDVFIMSGDWYIGIGIGEPIEHEGTNEVSLIEAIVEVDEYDEALFGKTVTLTGRIVFIEKWYRIHVDEVRFISVK